MKITFDYLEKNGYPSVTDYCRDLMKEGSKETTIEVYRGDMLCLTVDIVEAAKLTVVEGRHGPIFTKWKEFSEKDKERLRLKRVGTASGQVTG